MCVIRPAFLAVHARDSAVTSAGEARARRSSGSASCRLSQLVRSRLTALAVSTDRPAPLLGRYGRAMCESVSTFSASAEPAVTFGVYPQEK